MYTVMKTQNGCPSETNYSMKDLVENLGKSQGSGLICARERVDNENLGSSTSVRHITDVRKEEHLKVGP